jgi:hypothetical protein
MVDAPPRQVRFAGSVVAPSLSIAPKESSVGLLVEAIARLTDRRAYSKCGRGSGGLFLHLGEGA